MAPEGVQRFEGGYKLSEPLPDGRIRNPTPPQLKVGQLIGYAMRNSSGVYVGEYQSTVIEHNGRLAISNPVYLDSTVLSIGTIYPEETPVETHNLADDQFDGYDMSTGSPAILVSSRSALMEAVAGVLIRQGYRNHALNNDAFIRDVQKVVGSVQDALRKNAAKHHSDKRAHPEPIADAPMTLEEFLYVREHIGNSLAGNDIGPGFTEPVEADDYMTAERLMRIGAVDTKKILESRK